jgi:hypothetical protein
LGAVRLECFRAKADDVAISATILMAISVRISQIFCGLLTAVVDDVKVDLGAIKPL